MNSLSDLIIVFFKVLTVNYSLYLGRIKTHYPSKALLAKIIENDKKISELSLKINEIMSIASNSVNEEDIIQLNIINKLLDRMDCEKRIEHIPFENKVDIKKYPLYFCCIKALDYALDTVEYNDSYHDEDGNIVSSQIKIIVCNILNKRSLFQKYTNVLKDDIDFICEVRDNGGEDLEDFQYEALLIFLLIKIYILNYLNISLNYSYERKVAHYTNIDVAMMLIEKNTKLRLVSPEFMNDPSEGNMLFKFMNISPESSDDLGKEQLNFFSCFTFNHNSLNQFRLYGRKELIECSGVSLTINNKFFQENDSFNLYRCIYIEPKTGYLEVAKRSKWSFFQEYADTKSIDDIERLYWRYSKSITLRNKLLSHGVLLMKSLANIYDNSKNKIFLKILDHILTSLKFLFKHFSFKEEEECRLMTIGTLSSPSVTYDKKLNSTYIEYSKDVSDYLDNIYLGVASKDLLTAIKISALGKCSNLPKIKVSDNPYRVYKTIDKLS
ncbi:hypothetical protein [Acinetobacter sp. ABJ_C5_2]|uniref:hypothetical protein n=1 Tax=Acinetobacter sp. ABJ_C5_2 TaxID=3376992 RepID=UPI0037C56FEE